MTDWITQLDFSVLYRIQDALTCAFLDFLLPKCTFLGNTGLIWLLLAGVLLLFPKHRRTGILLLAGLGVGVLIGNVAMKNLFARPRPCWIDTAVPLLISVPKDFSFPSGHTLSSVIAATVLTAADRRFATFAVPLAALIAFSRLYLFVHFPTDVLASVILGIAVGVTVWKFGGRGLDRIASRTATPKNEPKQSKPRKQDNAPTHR